MAMGDEETALHLFHTALEAGTKMDIHRLRAECMVGIGDIKLRRGDLVQAKEMWAASRPLFIRSSRMKDARLVEKRLEQLTHTRQNNSHSQDGDVESTTVPFTTSHGDTATVQSSLEKLETLSAPNISPSLQTKTVVDPGSLTDRETKLSVL
jgi:hypothetical protein